MSDAKPKSGPVVISKSGVLKWVQVAAIACSVLAWATHEVFILLMAVAAGALVALYLHSEHKKATKE